LHSFILFLYLNDTGTNAIMHTWEYRVLPGVVWYIFIIFGLFTMPKTCAPDTKSWRCHK